MFFEIRTSPLDPRSLKNLQEIYVQLLLLRHDNDREPISYENILELFAIAPGKVRFAFLGEAGVGKTTFLAKIAYDWATGKHLRQINLLFFVPLKDTNKTPCLSYIPLKYLPSVRHLDSRKVETYIKENQKNVMLLLDGLDEYSGDITNEDPTDALIGIMRGDNLQQTPVIVTTRPWRAEQITAVENINAEYTRVLVKGFKESDIISYISKYFGSETESAESLIQLMTGDSLVAENMAPYPIFCSMLCHVWTDESRRKAILKLQTFSQLFDEMFDSLTNQWYSKDIKWNSRKRRDDTFRVIGKVAFEGLLTKQLVFGEKDFQKSPGSMQVGCDIGILSSEKRLVVQQEHAHHNYGNVSFPHKLFQEYLAGYYLASFYSEDQGKFKQVLKNKIIENYAEFRNLLYFTAAHGKKLGNAGKALMASLCTEVKDESFIVDVAFECHDEAAIAPVIELFNQKENVKLYHKNLSGYIDLSSKHTRSGCMYTWALCCRNLVIYDILNGFLHRLFLLSLSILLIILSIIHWYYSFNYTSI